jgi:hypothetical protein
MGRPRTTSETGCGCGGARCRLRRGDARHGSENGYGNYGCRCRRCTTAHRDSHHARMNADPDRLAAHRERMRERRRRERDGSV